MPQTLYEYGGSGAVIHMALANGFPPQTYQPLLQPFIHRYRVVSLPPRPLWDDPPAPTTVRTWADTADDLLAGLDAHNLDNVIGIGHSLGGVVTMLAAIKAPARFRGIILLDPTIFPPRMLWTLKLMRWLRLDGRFPLVQKALRRRAHFADAQEAFAYWRGKRLFHDWDDETLWLYVQGLTKPNKNGGLELAWSPAWEARYYATIYTESWQQVPKLRDLLPVLTVRATASNTFFEQAAALMQKQVPSMSYVEIEGAGHLFPQSAPNRTYTVIADWLARL